MKDFNEELDDIIGVEKKAITYVAFVLDESGSMRRLREEIVGGFNAQLETLIKKENDSIIKVSLVKFSNEPKSLFWNVEPSKVKKLTEKDYSPDGMTALCDATGMVIEEFKAIAEKNKEAAFLIMVMSDGNENASQIYTPAKIKAMIGEVMETKMWTFTYLGANQDMWEVSKSYGLSKGNTMAFSATDVGVRSAYTANSNAMDGYLSSRERGVTQVTSFYGGEDISKEVMDKIIKEQSLVDKVKENMVYFNALRDNQNKTLHPPQNVV
jgi:hypothetical protein